MLRVVSGALIRDGYILMGLRKKDGYRPDLWELPGGKVDPGESPHQALVREWREECGVDVTPGAFISMAMLHLDISFVIELYAITITNPVKLCADNCDHDPCSCGALDSYTPCSLDHQELRWVNPLYAVQRMPCSPAFYFHYPQLVKHIDASWPLSSCDFVGDSGCVIEDCPRCHPKDFLPVEALTQPTKHQLFIAKLEETARREGRQLSEGAQQAKLRPINYCEMSAQDQWAVDKRLGILDWDGA